MASYKIRVKRSAEKELRRIPKSDLRRIVRHIRGLAADPGPAGCRKLSTQERYRIRQGAWRILYEVDDAKRTVLVVKIGHRREIYR